MHHRAVNIIVLCLGVALLIGAVAFRAFAVPALVRFPLNIDETTHYTGTSVTSIDPATLLPLATPKVEPLSLDRRIEVVDGDFTKAVIDETVTIKAGSTKSVEKYQYVMDRRSMKFVSDPRQFAFGDPTAKIHAAGAYRVNFAMGTSEDGKYLSYIPEVDAAIPLTLAEGEHHHGDAGIDVIDFSSSLEKPVAHYYRAHLEDMGLPMEVTVAQLQPQLVAAGINVNAALADVLPLLTPDESKLLAETLGKAVPLKYFFIVDGLISVEAKTGALIDVHAQREGVAVKPDLSGVGALAPVLSKYSAIPSVNALSSGLVALAARDPQVAQELHYKQTVPSSLSVAEQARDQGRRMTIVTWWVPGAMAVLGLVLVAIGLIGWRRANARSRDVDVSDEPTAAAGAVVERQPV